MTELQGEEPYYTAPDAGNNGSYTAYHTDKNCSMLNVARDKLERSKEFIVWHDLDPCERCIKTDESSEEIL